MYGNCMMKVSYCPMMVVQTPPTCVVLWFRLAVTTTKPSTVARGHVHNNVCVCMFSDM